MKIMRYIILTLAVAGLHMSAIHAQEPVAEMTSCCDSLTVDDLDAQVVPMDTVAEPVATVEAETEPMLTLLPASTDTYEPHHGPDFRLFKSVTNPNIKPYTFMQDQTWVGIPIFLAGLAAKSEKAAFRQDYNNPNTKIRLVKYNFHTEIDNYTQFSGIALTAGLKLAGVEGRSDWPRLFASSLASYAVMAGFVNSIKYTASEMRPDGSTRNSWPSGHTATAFVGATILHKEYGLTRSPWYSIAGYTVATATGVMRVLNNRHWISDVLSGAGIGILSTELAYGICDLLFKDRGLLRNDLKYYSDLSRDPSFFSISMGIGLGNRDLSLPPFVFDTGSYNDGVEDDTNKEPLKLEFRCATAVGVEGAWFFCPYVGVGGRLRVKSTPIKGWNLFAQKERDELRKFIYAPIVHKSIKEIDLTIESDHITEFAGDVGVFFNLPLSSRFAIGSKLLVGRSVMDDIDVNASMEGYQLILDPEAESHEEMPQLIKTDVEIATTWDILNVSATNSMKFGSGISFTYSYKNSFSWRLFCDYDYAKKTYTASYCPFQFYDVFSPELVELYKKRDFDVTQTMTSSVRKHLHQWVLGGALCVSF